MPDLVGIAKKAHLATLSWHRHQAFGILTKPLEAFRSSDMVSNNILVKELLDNNLILKFKLEPRTAPSPG